MRQAHIERAPRATYRIQFHKEFTFRDAQRVVPYLAQLGVSHLYASPIFKANPGSSHGYDIVDYGQLNPEIGTEEEFNSFSATLKKHGLGLILDFVPNHMGIASGRNAWWQDVLEHGPASAYAPYFDIDWQPLKPELENQVLLPVLGNHYGIVLENQEFQLRYADGTFSLTYYDLPLPISPGTFPPILLRAISKFEGEFTAGELPLLEFQSVLASFERLRANNVPTDESMREQFLAKHRLSQLIATAPPIAAAIDESLAEFNGVKGDPASFDALDDLIGRQFYRLSFWRVAAEEINYRRFFAINTLAAIRQEEPVVFDDTHRLLLRLIGEGKVEGVRIDHPDGLWDPAGYFRRLQASVSAMDRSIYLVIEKILEHGEELPEDWPVDGSVGYEFAQIAGGVLVDGRNRKEFDQLYARFAGQSGRFEDMVYDKKKLIMRVALASEVNVLARALDRLTEFHRRTRDFTFYGLRDAMIEIIACFPIYRTYAVCDPEAMTERDRAYVIQAVSLALRRNLASDPGVFAFVRDILLLEDTGDLIEAQRDDQCRFVAKFQQLTGPVMAKGLEDTAFYGYYRLASLNEVGGDPAQFGVDVRDFHRHNLARLERWPRAMLASSTHDTKRSEDVRARVSVLSEIPRTWRAALNRWARMNRRFKIKIDGALAPDRHDEYLFYQTVLGAWSLELARPDADFIDRIDAYLLKAIREAQVHSTWINPNEAYDAAARAFVRGALDPKNAPFLQDIGRLRDRIAVAGASNSLSQQLLKVTAPGVPDLYQGTELWDFSLVDPDNRRPVDFIVRANVLNGFDAADAFDQNLVENWADGRIKLWLTQRTLAHRRDQAELYSTGAYISLSAFGSRAGNVIAFARQQGEREAVVIAPRLPDELSGDSGLLPLGPVWRDTRVTLSRALGGRRFRNVFTLGEFEVREDREIILADLLTDFPLALLERID